jgi:hypothetical protein
MNRYSPFILAGILILTTIAAEHFQLYYRIDNLDKLLHILGGLAVAWAFSHEFSQELKNSSPLKKAILLIACGALVGVLWEMAEFVSNGFHYTHPFIYKYFHGGDLNDTIGDLAADVFGSGIFALLYLKFSPKSQFPGAQVPFAKP